MNTDQFRMLVNSRVRCRGGGIGLISRKEYSVKTIKNGTKPSFQYSIWSVKARHMHLTIVGLYHPPYSSIYPANSIFIDEIIELLTEILPASNNHIILGDFNLHINNIFTEIMSNIGVEVVETAAYISDHCPVIATLNIKKEQVKQVQRVICKAVKINQEEWNREFNRLNIRWCNNLCSLVNQLNNELVRVYDVLAPPNWVLSFLRIKQPWYDSEMKEFKKSVRHHEWKWLKYRLDSCWRAYRNVRIKYFGKF